MNADTAIAEMHAEEALYSAEKFLSAINEAIEQIPDDMPNFLRLLDFRLEAERRIAIHRRTLGISNGDTSC